MINKKWFTLIELLVVIMMLWVWLIWVFQTMWKSYNFLSNIKSKLMAINFARWWVEGVFTIRNTNWQRWWGKKDQCWLKINPLIDENLDNKCENDPWFTSWSYILDITWTQQYFYLSWENNPLRLRWSLINNDWNYLLCKDPNDWLVKACPNHNHTSRPANYFSPELYFRQVRWWYLLDKKSNEFLKSCNTWSGTYTDTGTSIDCWWDSFKEKNFCVDVMYFNWSKKSVSFCSVMTNFKE